MDKMLLRQPYLLVGRCTKILNPGTKDAAYMIRIRRNAKYVVGLGKEVAETDVEEGMRIGVKRLIIYFLSLIILDQSIQLNYLYHQK